MELIADSDKHCFGNCKTFSFAAACLLFLSFSIFSAPMQSDTIALALKEAEQIFLDNNLQVLAQKCNVDAARAQVMQCRLWDNPTVTVNQNVYNTESSQNGARKWFPLSDNGETNLQVQQLFSIAGKRNKRIKLADLTAQKTEYLLFDLLRTLKYQLRGDFYKLYFTQEMLSVYTTEIESIDKLVAAFEEQYRNGHVSKRELLRLKASLFSLENEKLALDNQLVDTRADFILLLHLRASCPIAVADARSLDSAKVDDLALKDLIDTALCCRNDLKAAHADLQFNRINLDYQKALAIPDLQGIAGWDKNGSYVHNYNFLGIQVDVPFFNRNQGNIKSALAACQSSQYNYQGAQDVVISDVTSAYSKVLQCDKLYKQFDRGFNADFASMREEVLKNYKKRNLSLLEFLDFYDAYKQNAIQFSTLQDSRVNALEGINYSVGKNLIVW
jgi:outer membrane protein, heavy metal efflux system